MSKSTHQREFRGMAPTGEEMEIKGMAVFRFTSEGKMVESWDSYDQLSLMRQSIEQELRVARRIQQIVIKATQLYCDRAHDGMAFC